MRLLLPELVIYGRIMLYLFTVILLLMFSVIHKGRVRRLRNFALALFFLTVAVSLVVRLVSGAVSQTVVNDFFTTPVLLLYALLLAFDFWHVSRGGKPVMK